MASADPTQRADARSPWGGSIHDLPTPEERVQRAGRLFGRLVMVAAVGLAGWGALFAYSADRADARRGVDVDGIVGDRCSFDRRTDPGRSHVESPRYTVDPPSGGPHLPRPASPGFKEVAATPPDGAVVHAMEHGFVVVWYHAGDPAIEELRALAREERAVIAVARPAMAVRIAVTAWGRRLLCDSITVDQIRRFVRAFAGRGPERVAI